MSLTIENLSSDLYRVGIGNQWVSTWMARNVLFAVSQISARFDENIQNISGWATKSSFKDILFYDARKINSFFLAWIFFYFTNFCVTSLPMLLIFQWRKCWGFKETEGAVRVSCFIISFFFLSKFLQLAVVSLVIRNWWCCYVCCCIQTSLEGAFKLASSFLFYFIVVNTISPMALDCSKSIHWSYHYFVLSHQYQQLDSKVQEPVWHPVGSCQPHMGPHWPHLLHCLGSCDIKPFLISVLDSFFWLLHLVCWQLEYPVDWDMPGLCVSLRLWGIPYRSGGSQLSWYRQGKKQSLIYTRVDLELSS